MKADPPLSCPRTPRWPSGARTAKKCSARSVKARLQRVKTPVEHRKPRLCHNRAIETRLGASASGGLEGHQGDFSRTGWGYPAACSAWGLEGQVALPRNKPISSTIARPAVASLATAFLAANLAGCGAQIDRHGHVFMDVDLEQIQRGMSKQQVTTVLGSPDTTSSIGGDAYYYISTTQKSYAFFKPWEIDRKVVAVYFDGQSTVQNVARYGLKDGIVVRYAKDETPARGKDLSVLEQIFGNISQRKMFKGQQPGASGMPGSIPGTY